MLRRVPPLAVAIVLVAASSSRRCGRRVRPSTTRSKRYATAKHFQFSKWIRADLAEFRRPANKRRNRRDRARARRAGPALPRDQRRARARRVSAGNPLGAHLRGGTNLRVDHFGERVRVETRVAFRRAWGGGRGPVGSSSRSSPARRASCATPRLARSRSVRSPRAARDRRLARAQQAAAPRARARARTRAPARPR